MPVKGASGALQELPCLSAGLILAQGNQLLPCLACRGKVPSRCTTLREVSFAPLGIQEGIQYTLFQKEREVPT